MATGKPRNTPRDDTRPDDRRPAGADFTVGPSGSVAPASLDSGTASDPVAGGPSARPGHGERPLSDDDPVRRSIADAAERRDETGPLPSADTPGGMTGAGRIALVLAAVVAVLILILLI